MKLSIKFLEEKESSMFGTLNTSIILALTLLTKQKVNLQNMVISSVLCMMDGDLLPKILFTGFLNFMIMEETIDWVIRSFIYVIAVVIIDNIKYNNFIHKFSYQNEIILSILGILIVIWMMRIFDFIFVKTKKIYNKLIKN
jgi:hypothetical protein